MLYQSVVNLFSGAITDSEALVTKFSSLMRTAAGFNPEAIPSRKRFLLRRVKLLKNLLRWRKFTGEKYGVGRLITQLIDSPLLVIAENGWDVGGEAVMRQVNACYCLHGQLLIVLCRW
jgi:GC-rich sequence DNA-binding factor